MLTPKTVGVQNLNGMRQSASTWHNWRSRVPPMKSQLALQAEAALTSPVILMQQT